MAVPDVQDDPWRHCSQSFRLDSGLLQSEDCGGEASLHGF
jgi:hypothetical protein